MLRSKFKPGLSAVLLIGMVSAAACGSSGDSGDGDSPRTQAPGAPGTVGIEAVQPTFASLQTGVFQPRCISCHGPARTEAGLNLSTYDSLQASNATHGHPVIVPGNPEESHLFQMVQSGQMPQGGPKLNDAEIAAIRAWIQNGAKND